MSGTVFLSRLEIIVDAPIVVKYRPHEGLNGTTPAEAAGIKVKGRNKWLTLIQNASHAEKSNE